MPLRDKVDIDDDKVVVVVVVVVVVAVAVHASSEAAVVVSAASISSSAQTRHNDRASARATSCRRLLVDAAADATPVAPSLLLPSPMTLLLWLVLLRSPPMPFATMALPHVHTLPPLLLL